MRGANAHEFGLHDDDLHLDLGPLGRLLKRSQKCALGNG
jgi:hypothetical protein